MQENSSKQGLNGFLCQVLITKIVYTDYTSRMTQCFFFFLKLIISHLPSSPLLAPAIEITIVSLLIQGIEGYVFFHNFHLPLT